MNDNVLSLRNVTFGFAGVQRPLFYNVNVSFATGKIHVIRGRNGVGKSTLFRILQGQVYPGEQFSGSLYLDNRKYDERALKKCELKDMLQLVPQKFDCALADECSFDQNLALAQIPYLPRLTGLPKKQVVPDFIERFGIDVNKPVKQLSGGQRQILAIVMALQKSRKILLLDEPTAALDEKNAHMVFSFLQELVATYQMTILIICHDKGLADKFAPDGHFEIVIDPETNMRNVCFDV